jgi:hypothetical protein
MRRLEGRTRLAAIHLAIGAALVGALVAATLWVWYPQPFFRASGAVGLAFLTLGLGVLAGPLLTWIVARPGKAAHLVRFDLVVIALVQVAAVGYGAWVMAQARPAYLLFVRDRFEITNADELVDAQLARAAPGFRARPWTGPRLAAAVLPLDPDERRDLMFAALAGLDLRVFPQYYAPYDSEIPTVLAKARPLAELRAHRPEAAGTIARAVRSTGLEESQLAYLPLRGRKADMAVLVERETGRIAGYAAVDPW